MDSRHRESSPFVDGIDPRDVVDPTHDPEGYRYRVASHFSRKRGGRVLLAAFLGIGAAYMAAMLFLKPLSWDFFAKFWITAGAALVFAAIFFAIMERNNRP